MSTEYEQLLKQLIDDRKSKLESLKGDKGKKRADQILSEISYIELELQRYSEGLTLFRRKSVPKVGRWGKSESEEHAQSPAN